MRLPRGSELVTAFPEDVIFMEKHACFFITGMFSLEKLYEERQDFLGPMKQLAKMERRRQEVMKRELRV